MADFRVSFIAGFLPASLDGDDPHVREPPRRPSPNRLGRGEPTKRLDDGDQWFSRVLAIPVGSAASRARALYDHGYLVFWAGRYDLASKRFTESRALAASLADATLQALALTSRRRCLSP